MIKNFLLTALTTLLSFFSFNFIAAQQNVFSRSEVTTGNFGDGQLPWFYQTSNNSQGDPDNGSATRNFVKIGHNNNTTMTTNGRFYLLNTLDFEASATSARTINNSGGGLSASGGIYNASTATHTFNTPIGIDGSIVQLHANASGGLVFTETIFINNNTIEFGNLGSGEITVSGDMQGSGNISKVGSNTLTISGSHTYTGTTIINEGTLKLQGNISNSDITVKSGATLEIDGTSTVNSILVEAGGLLKVNSGQTLIVSNEINLESTSTSYSSLISDGNISGTINYKRFVNIVGTGATGTGGNDLISLPLMPSEGISFDEFIALGNPANSTKLATNGVFYAFAPYNNLLSLYTNFLVNGSDALIKGKGYRVATTSGENLTFTGTVETGNVSIGISTPIIGNQWNLIGNPYPSYIDPIAFLTTNAGVFDDNAVAVYGYNSGTYSGTGATNGNFTIINMNTNSNLKIAPGQGFFIAARDVPNFSGSIGFTNGTLGFADMRTSDGENDFIESRTDTNYNLNLDLTNTSTYTTSFYFNANSSLGLDPGYDAAVFWDDANSFPIYSHLVNDNVGRAMAIQSLAQENLADVTIPLGVNTSQGQQVTFSISFNSLPDSIDVYLDDTVADTSTLLNTSDYVLTPITNLNGTGRFYLRFSNTTLSNPEVDLDTINIYTNQDNKTIVIAGQVLEDTRAMIYDLQGRLVSQTNLSTSEQRQSIDVAHLSTGVYVVQLQNASQHKTKKVILK